MTENTNVEGKTKMRKIIVEAEVSVDGAMGGENMDFGSRITHCTARMFRNTSTTSCSCQTRS